MVVYSTRIDTHNVHNLKHSHTYTNQSRERLVEHFPFFFLFFFFGIAHNALKGKLFKTTPQVLAGKGKKRFCITSYGYYQQ